MVWPHCDWNGIKLPKHQTTKSNESQKKPHLGGVQQMWRCGMVVSGHGGDGLMVGPDDLSGLSNPDDSLIL